MESILDSVKKALGIAADYTEFDVDIILHINSAFSTLHQLGVGPSEGFEIENSTTTWDAFLLNDKRYNFVKQYVYSKVRIMFDPPTIASVLDAMNRSVTELEWRINVVREGDVYGLPVVTSETIFDGGAP